MYLYGFFFLLTMGSSDIAWLQFFENYRLTIIVDWHICTIIVAFKKFLQKYIAFIIDKPVYLLISLFIYQSEPNIV